MSLTRLAIKRPVIVRMMLILIIILGIYSYRSTPRYLNPDITIGEAFIMTIVPGFSPEEVEKLVTNKIEDKLRGISEIKSFKSLSIEGTSDIDISFQPDLSEEEIDAGMQKIRNAVTFMTLIGGKSTFWSPLATAIMWGLGFSTILILTMAPAYYLILEDIRYLVRHRRRRKSDARRAIDKAFMSEELRPSLQ